MKKSVRICLGAILIFSMISSCDVFKDEEMPDTYSESVKNVDGTWQLSSVSRNGIDITHSMDFDRFCILLNKDNTYQLKNYLPFIVRDNGTWSVDDPQYPFHITFNEKSGAGKEVKTEIGFKTVDGNRQLTIKLSPGCYTNSYIYTFKKVLE